MMLTKNFFLKDLHYQMASSQILLLVSFLLFVLCLLPFRKKEDMKETQGNTGSKGTKRRKETSKKEFEKKPSDSVNT